MRELGAATAITAAIAVFALAVVGLAGGESDDAALTTETATLTPALTLSSGAQLFVSAGCASCHGASGEGGIGPALPGHTVEQVIRQARRPLNVMPLFSSEELSDRDLQLIADYVGGLPAQGAGHQADDESSASVLDLRDEITMHHWMALSAIRNGTAEAAGTHVSEIVELVGGEHQTVMRETLLAIEAGDLRRAETLISEMLAGFEPDVTDQQIRLRLALQALVVDDIDAAIADLDAFVAAGAEEQVADVVRAIRAIRARDFLVARELIEPLSGLPAHDDGGAHEAPAD